MRKAGTLLCGILVAALLSGCGDEMIDLTQEETELITEYTVGLLLKYDKYYGSRLVDTTAYDVAVEEVPEETVEEMPEEEPEQVNTTDETEVIDASQDAESSMPLSTIEEYYGIEGITFQYLGYDLTQSYPSSTAAMVDATVGSQLLVLRFTAMNESSMDQTLNMLDHGAKFSVSVNGGPEKDALRTILLDDMQAYNGVLSAGNSVELVSIVEVPQADSIETIDLILRGGDENVTMTLQ